LQGRLPLRREFNLAPGEYILGCVCPNSASEHHTFFTWSDKALVERGGRTVHKIDGTIYVIPAEGWWPPPYPLPNLGDQISEKALINRFDQDVWQRFLESPRWKPINRAADQLKITPPSRRRVWIDLEWHLGFPREVDVEQLRVIRKWFYSKYWRIRAEVDGELMNLDLEDAAKQFKRRDHQLWIQLMTRARERTSEVIDEIIKALETAPEDR
jgi:hypothetical protein